MLEGIKWGGNLFSRGVDNYQGRIRGIHRKTEECGVNWGLAEGTEGQVKPGGGGGGLLRRMSLLTRK